MFWILIFVAVPAGLILIVTLIGLALPEAHVASRAMTSTPDSSDLRLDDPGD
ncbi:MAG: hypothetical protein MOB07_17685 [Acidobacteria bacterium]|nr:hypothetical protein [Acidobacteriota bacterium]